MSVSSIHVTRPVQSKKRAIWSWNRKFSGIRYRLPTTKMKADGYPLDSDPFSWIVLAYLSLSRGNPLIPQFMPAISGPIAVLYSVLSSPLDLSVFSQKTRNVLHFPLFPGLPTPTRLNTIITNFTWIAVKGHVVHTVVYQWYHKSYICQLSLTYPIFLLRCYLGTLRPDGSHIQ